MVSARAPRIALAALALLASSCAMRNKGAPTGWPATTDWIVDGRTGETVPFATMIAELEGADVVFVGEDHANPHHHEAQARIARALLDRKPALAFGFEMLQVDSQKAADRYVEGAIDIDGLVKETNWRRTWGFPVSLYRPLFELARTHKASVVALNAPEDLVQRIRTVGIDGLSAEEKAGLPELDLEDPAHQEWVRSAFAAHHALPEDRFRRFYSIQVLWDETMAESISRAIRSGDATPLRPMIVFAGTGHLIRRLGIPSRLERRVPDVKMRVVLALPVLEDTPREIKRSVEARDADFLWITPDVESM